MKQDETKFIQQQPQTQMDRQRQDSDSTFFIDNYGGLNKTSVSVNLPYSDSPDMLNCKVSLSGTLAKRDGSFIRQITTGQPDGSVITSFNLIDGNTLLISKRGKNLDIYLLPDEDSLTSASLLVTYPNVWSTLAEQEKPSVTWTSEIHPRLIMATPSNTVVELEINQVKMTGDGDTTIVLNGDYTTLWGKDYSFGIYGSTIVTVTNVVYSAPNTTFTFSDVIPLNQIITLVQPTWHWWAESIKRTAEQVYTSTFRFNTSVNADANVEIPSEMRRGLEADTLAFGSSLAYGVKPLLVWKSNSATPTAFVFDSTPDDKEEFAFSNKVYTTGAGADYISPGTSWLTFGGIDGTGTNPPTPIHIVRQVYLPFNGGAGTVCTDIQVYNSQALKLQARYNATLASNDATNQYYWLLNSSMAVETTDTNTTKAIVFSGGYPYGISGGFVEIINAKLSTTVIGTAAVATYYSPKTPGTYRPWYGASLYANFSTGVFPSVVGLYQDRLVLSGFASSPLTVLFSNSADNGSRYFYQNFQVDFDDTTLAYTPVEVNLDGSVEDGVTNVLPWFNSLFLTTRKTTRRIHGGDAVAITPANVFQNTISGVGCLSRQGMTKTDDSVVFISASGLYSINLAQQNSEYTALNIGIKVKDYFVKNNKNPSKSWIFYNQLDDEVWVGLSSGNDDYLPDTCLVLFNQREAWSEYGLTGGFLPSISGCSDSKRSFVCVINRDTDVSTEPSTSSQLLITEFNMERVLTDLTTAPTHTQMVAGYTTNLFHRRLEVTANTNQRIISTLPAYLPTNYSNHGFKSLPLTDRENNIVVRKYNGIFWESMTVAASQITLMPSNYSIRFATSPYYTGDLVEIKLLNDAGNDPINVFRDNFELLQDTEYTLEEDGHFHKVTVVTAGDSDSLFLVGETIPCWHFTPTFFRSGIGSLKRAVHYTGYYSNKYYHDLWKTTDVNSEAGQPESELSDNYKVQTGVSLGMLYNDARNGNYESEVYGADELFWDTSFFDYQRDSARNQLNDVVRTTIPVIGIGYSLQVVNFDFSVKRFELIGFSVETKAKGNNSTRWY